MQTDEPQSVLVITAHPDDVDFGAAGTIAKWTAQGTQVSYLIVTDGDAGGFDHAIARSEMPAIRRREQTEAARIVGVTDVGFLGRPDGQVVADLSLRRDIARVIRQVRPERVLCPSPERDFSRIPASHPDHLATGEAALSAVYPDARNAFAFPELLKEGFEPHTVNEVWLMASPTTNHPVDITDYVEQKIAALCSHKSQLPDPAAVVERIRTFTGQLGEKAGFGIGHFAEAFFEVAIP